MLKGIIKTLQCCVCGEQKQSDDFVKSDYPQLCFKCFMKRNPTNWGGSKK
jgi:formylmethanofuran dehydrogenase subunit E